MHPVEKALHERGPLQGKGCDQEVEAHAAEAVALQEGHEEAETDEDHHVHILETCTKLKILKDSKDHETRGSKALGKELNFMENMEFRGRLISS